MPKQSWRRSAEHSAYEQQLARAIGLRIRERRVVLGLTQPDVRTLMEEKGIYISKSQYSRIETGDSLLSAAEVIVIAKVLYQSAF